MTVREDGRPVSLRKRDIIIKQMIGQALNGDKAAVKLLLALVEKAAPPAMVDAAAEPRTVEADQTDRDILAWYAAQSASQGDVGSEPLRVCRRLIDVSYAAMVSVSRAA